MYVYEYLYVYEYWYEYLVGITVHTHSGVSCFRAFLIGDN